MKKKKTEGEVVEDTLPEEEGVDTKEQSENDSEAAEAAPETEQVEEQERIMLETKEAEIKELNEKILRIHADFDNYRKRAQREKEEWVKYSSLDLIDKLLPVIDNLERAAESLEQQDENIKKIFAGIEMIYRQLMEVLGEEGLKKIECLGKVFDPQFHEAMMQVEAEEGQEDNEIVEELRKGYCFKDRVVRPTMVKVAKK